MSLWKITGSIHATGVFAVELERLTPVPFIYFEPIGEMNALPAHRPLRVGSAKGDAVERHAAGAIERQTQMALPPQPQVADHKFAVEQGRRIALAPGRDRRDLVGQRQREVLRRELAIAQ